MRVRSLRWPREIPTRRLLLLTTRLDKRTRKPWNAALRPKVSPSRGSQLRNVVASKLILDWSPEQICGWLKTQYPDDESMRESHQTIYRSLFIQARGILKKELMDSLRSKPRMRLSRQASDHEQSRGRIVATASLRAEAVDERFPATGK